MYFHPCFSPVPFCLPVFPLSSAGEISSSFILSFTTFSSREPRWSGSTYQFLERYFKAMIEPQLVSCIIRPWQPCAPTGGQPWETTCEQQVSLGSQLWGWWHFIRLVLNWATLIFSLLILRFYWRDFMLHLQGIFAVCKSVGYAVCDLQAWINCCVTEHGEIKRHV